LFLEFPGGKAPVAVQVKTRASAATAWQLVHQAERNRDVPVPLIAGEITAGASEVMADHRIAVIDGLGNARIELPGLLIHMEGRRPHGQARPARLADKAGVIAQALLLHPGHGWQVQEPAQEAGAPVVQLVEYGIDLGVCANDPHLHVADLPGRGVPRQRQHDDGIGRFAKGPGAAEFH
jgi:hypothetical protein